MRINPRTNTTLSCKNLNAFVREKNWSIKVWTDTPYSQVATQVSGARTRSWLISESHSSSDCTDA